MQKHNKYLVVTIWIATIAFIGAGFVGWGTYQYGSKASAIARVGDIDITQEKFDFVYQNIYSDFANKMPGYFDNKKAKELGLTKIAYNQLVTQALILNLAKEYGVVVSDEELAKEIASNPNFFENGKFSKRVYEIYLKNRGLKPKTFEKIVRDDLVVLKLLKILNVKALPYEESVIASILGVEDKVKFDIIKSSDIKVSINDDELKRYWEKNKDKFKTQKKYKLAIKWVETSDINATDDELMKFYQKNSFNYLDDSGKELSFQKAKEQVLRDYKIKKAKKRALLAQIAIKKKKEKINNILELNLNDKSLTKELWSKIESSKKGDLLKPKVVGDRYAIVKVLDVINPRVKTFQEAKSEVEREFKALKKRELLAKKAKELLDKDKFKYESGFIGISNFQDIPNLTDNQKALLAKAIFSSFDKKGKVNLGDSVIVFKIIDQKIKKANLAESKRVANSLKSLDFQNNLLKALNSKYEVKTFVKGL